jgi:hypothetical protein
MFPPRNSPDRDAFMDGYRHGEGERISLAAENSLLRSEIQNLRRVILDLQTGDTADRYDVTP